MSEKLLETIEKLGGAFEEFKRVNDQRLAEIEKKGVADPLTVEQLQTIEQRMDELEATKDRLERMETRMLRPQGNGQGVVISPEQEKHREAFEAWLRRPDEERSANLQRAAMEAKAVSSNTSSGGHAIPEVIGRRIQETLQLESPMRRVVNVIQVGTSDYKELVDVNGEEGGWVGETSTRSDTAEPALNQVTPTMGEVYARPSVYEHILDDAFFDIQSWLVNKTTRAMARLEGEAFISGNGTNKPTGFLNGSPVSTGDFDSPARTFQVLQYVPTGAAGAFVNDRVGSPPGDPGDVFIDTIHAMRPGWRPGAVWLMNTTTKGTIRKFKDADGNYLMRPGLEAGEGSMIFGYPIVEMDHMPDIGSNTFPVAFGNFREAYLAVERTTLRITIDDNITTPGTVKYYLRRRVGGIVRQDQAIKLIKAAAS